MLKPRRAFEVNKHGLSLDDITYIISGAVDPWLIIGTNQYKAGSVFLKNNGVMYIKQPAGYDATTQDWKEIKSFEGNLLFTSEKLSDGKWLSIGEANDIRSGYIQPSNGLISGVSIHAAENKNSIGTIDIFVGSNVVYTLTVPIGKDVAFSDFNVNIPFNINDKIRALCVSENKMKNIVLTVFTRYY